MSNETLQLFYETEFSHHEDLANEVAEVASRKPPFFDKKPVFADLSYRKYVSKIEEKIITENEFP